MFFLAALHALFQAPKDLYYQGIGNCQTALHEPFADESSNTLIVKYEKFNLVDSTIQKRIKITFPSASEDFKKQISDLLTPLLDQAVWAEDKTFVILINGYETTTKKSGLLTIKLTNEGISEAARAAGISMLIQTAKADAQYPESFQVYTTFDFTGETISNVKTSITKEEITTPMIVALSPAVAPLFFGSTFMQKTFLVSPSIDYLEKYLAKYCELLEYDVEEVTEAIAEFRQLGKINFSEIAQKVRKVCLTTPTPSPMPTPEPTTEGGEEQEEEEKDLDKLEHKLQDLKDLFHKFRRNEKPRKLRERHHHRHH